MVVRFPPINYPITLPNPPLLWRPLGCRPRSCWSHAPGSPSLPPSRRSTPMSDRTPENRLWWNSVEEFVSPSPPLSVLYQTPLYTPGISQDPTGEIKVKFSWMYTLYRVHLNSSISLHDVEHPILGVELLVFAGEVGIDVVVCCSKWIRIWLPFTLSRYLLRIEWR